MNNTVAVWCYVCSEEEVPPSLFSSVPAEVKETFLMVSLGSAVWTCLVEDVGSSCLT